MKIIKWIHSQSEQTKQIIYRWLPIFDFAFSKESYNCQTRRFTCDCFCLLYFCECACSIASESVTIMSECVRKTVDTTVRTTTIHHADVKEWENLLIWIRRVCVETETERIGNATGWNTNRNLNMNIYPMANRESFSHSVCLSVCEFRRYGSSVMLTRVSVCVCVCRT